MTIQEAEQELARLCDGKYHAVQYDLSAIEPGKLKQKCWCYIDGIGWADQKPTWAEALQSIADKINPAPPKIEDSGEEVPAEAPTSQPEQAEQQQEGINDD